VHAVFERFGDTWFVRDLGSRNGTFVNGEKIIGERALHAGDEILLGRLRLLFRGPALGTETAAVAQAPPLTPRERDVLALCRPLHRRCVHRAGVDPAIAAELVVSAPRKDRGLYVKSIAITNEDVPASVVYRRGVTGWRFTRTADPR
jgi:hypothetical protein